MTGRSPLNSKNPSLTKGEAPPRRFRLPRKGRIRAVLALVIIGIAAFKIVGAFTKASPIQKNSSATILPAKSDPGAAAELTAAFPAFGNKLDESGIALLLAKNPPKLPRERDTLSVNDTKLVLSYSIDTALQHFAEELLKQRRPKYGSGAVIDPKSGRVLALVSYRNDTARDIGDRLYLRNTFPAASVYKTITAAAAIESAHYSAQTPVSLVGANHTLYHSQLKKESRPWKEIPFEQAYALSINPVFGRLGMHTIGKKALETYAEKFGFNTRIPFDLPIDSSLVNVPDDTTFAMAELASGFNRHTRISALHGALIAASIAEDGAMPCPTLVDSVNGAGGECLYRAAPAVWKRSVSAATASELRLLMNKVVEEGTGRKSFRAFRHYAWSAPIDCGGKTGSIDIDTVGKIDWFIGFAVDRDDPARSLAVAFVTAHGAYWTVHSSFLCAEVFRRYFQPERKSVIVKKAAAEPRRLSELLKVKAKG
jgi:penicillin-binding protein A